MIIKNLDSVAECSSCRNIGICKYTNEFKELFIKADKIEIEINSPMSLVIKCNKHERVPQKQDGFYNNR